MSQMVPGSLLPGQMVQGQVVTAAQVVNAGGVSNIQQAPGQVVMSNNGIVGGQLVDQLVVASHPQHVQQQLQNTAVTNATLQPQVIQQQQQQAAVIQDSAGVLNANTVPPNVVHQQQPTVIGTMLGQPQQLKVNPVPPPSANIPVEPQAPVINRSRLTDLVREVDPTEQLDEEVEDVLLAIADDFIESSVSAACRLAKHRGARTLDVKDLHMYLERSWHMWIPGFGSDEIRPYKRAPTTEAHKQRMALIRKAVKKY